MAAWSWTRISTCTSEKSNSLSSPFNALHFSMQSVNKGNNLKTSGRMSCNEIRVLI